MGLPMAQGMDREKLEPIAREMMVKASKNLKNDGFVAFAVILHMKNGRTIPVSVQGDEDSDKEHLGRTLRGLARECKFIVIINEMWLVLNPPEAGISMPVRNHPRRIEGICVSAQSPHGEFMLVHKFERDSNNVPLESTEAHTVWMEGPPPTPTNFQGLFH